MLTFCLFLMFRCSTWLSKRSYFRMFYADFVKRYNLHHSSSSFYDEKELTFVILVDFIGTDSTGSPPEEKCRSESLDDFVERNQNNF